MKVTEFVKKMNESEDINLKTMLEIRTYIPIAEKKAILETILDRCFTVEDGVLMCDSVLKKMMFESAMVKYHTNLDLDITSEEDYDELRRYDLMSIVNIYERDYEECDRLLEGMERELRAQYSVEASIAFLTNQLSDHMTELAQSLTHKIESFDMSKFGFEGVELDKLKNLLNKYGK